MTLAMHFTLYAVRRDHGIRTEFFRVQVREPLVRDDGIGVQFRWGPTVFGASAIIRRTN